MKKIPLLYGYIGKKNFKLIAKKCYEGQYRDNCHPIYAMIKTLHSNLQQTSDIFIRGKQLEEAITLIINHNDAELISFLKNHLNKNLLASDITTINGGIAEIIACSNLLTANFNVNKIKESKNKTPDFECFFNNENFYIEVNCKHYKENEKTVIKFPKQTTNDGKITIQSYIIDQFGLSSKPNENELIQGIQKIAQIKDKSEQATNEKIPFILWIDLWNGNYEFSEEILGNSSPFKVYNKTISSDIIWHALYGWKNCPIFFNFPISWLIELQKNNSFFYKIKNIFTKKNRHTIPISKIISKMQHDGKFIKDNKVSAIIFSFKNMKYICENPYAKNKLSKELRLQLLNIPGVNISKSKLNLCKNQVKNLIYMYRHFLKSIKTK